MAKFQIQHIGALPGTLPVRTLLVSSDQDFCVAAAALRCDHAAEYDAIWIRQSHHFAWMQALVEHIGLHHVRPVEFGKTSARDVLASIWKLPIPDWLTDELILAENLLERPLPAGTHDSAASILLSALVTPINLISATFPRAQAGLLAEKASAQAFQDGLAGSGGARAAWENTLKSWASSGSPSWAVEFCARLSKDPQKLWIDLTVWRLLYRYPAAQQEFALDPSAVAFVRNLPVEALKGMALHPNGRALAYDQIQPVFEQLLAGPVSRSKFDAILSATSGELAEEFFNLEAILDKAAFKIERNDTETIVRRFQSCTEIGMTAFETLRLHLRPPEPASIDASAAGVSTWSRWFHDQYLPYRRWQLARKEADAAVEKTVGDFSEWYCREYGQVHADPNYSLIQALTQWRTSILSDSISLILLVDNLPWFFWPSLERALADAGLHRHQSQARFAPLPSLTSISKPAIVSGRWDVVGSDYTKMLELRSAQEWSGRAVQYLPGVSQLAGQKDFSKPCVLLLNYLASDEALHSDSAAAGITHADELALRYKSLCQALGDFARRAGQQGRKFGLYVVTDHGSTSILPSETKSVDAQLTKRLFPNEKYRSATMSAEEASSVPDNLWELGFRFTNPCHPEGIVHFIPRGHNTVASLTKQVFCHGGATPEEVIVPSAIFRLFRANWIQPAVRFLTKMKDGRASFYVKRMANVDIEIQNKNSVEVQLESVSIIPNVGEIRDFNRAVIAPNTVGKGTVSLYFGATATTTSQLSFDFNFRLAQEFLTRRVELPVSISSAASTGTDLTNLIS